MPYVNHEQALYISVIANLLLGLENLVREQYDEGITETKALDFIKPKTREWLSSVINELEELSEEDAKLLLNYFELACNKDPSIIKNFN